MADIGGTLGALYLLLPISLLLVVAIGAFFWWAIFSGQFDDVEKAGRHILSDPDTPEPAPPPAGQGGAPDEASPGHGARGPGGARPGGPSGADIPSADFPGGGHGRG